MSGAPANLGGAPSARAVATWLGSRQRRLSMEYSAAMADDINPLGTRKDGLDAFLDQRIAERFIVETRTDTHAIIFRQPRGMRRFTSGDDPGRYGVEGGEDGVASMRPAEPRQS
jgi:hypothetical protein